MQLEFKYVGQGLLTSFAKKDFYKQLKKYLKKKESNTKDFWSELNQKYSTVLSITGQIKEGINVIFEGGAKDWSLKILNFEKEYQTKWGQFFTEFVKANDRSYKKISSKNFENRESVLASYNHLTELAVQIGEESMAVLENLQNYNKQDEQAISKLENLKTDSLLRFDTIMGKCSVEIDKFKNLSQ